jgi:solute carrier family 25 oxoglutarate transporter 11
MTGMMATCVIQPTDIIKMRLQINSELRGLGDKTVTTNPFTITKNIYKNEGFKTFYTGLGCGLYR